MRILVAEDDQTTRQIIERLVTHLGHEPLLASSGEEAWGIFVAARPEVVISDWEMGSTLSGPDLCARVREHDNGTRYTFFILLTAARIERSHQIEAMSSGADEYLRKPLERDELVARLIGARRLLGLISENISQRAELERLNAILAAQNRRDALTMVGNRLHLDERLGELCSDMRGASRSWCLALSDVDFFKRYNDQYGHPAGDDVLRDVADAMRDAVRPQDEVFRYGGEEFALLLPDVGPTEASIVVERVRMAVEERSIPHAGNEAADVITISLGYAVEQPRLIGSPTAWLSIADAGLYAAKHLGRNRAIDGHGAEQIAAMTQARRTPGDDRASVDDTGSP